MQSIFPLGFAPPWKSKIPQHKHGLCKKQKPNRSTAQRVRFGKEEQGSGRMTLFCSAGIKNASEQSGLCSDVVPVAGVDLRCGAGRLRLQSAPGALPRAFGFDPCWTMQNLAAPMALRDFGAGGGGRTRTSLRTRDFESRASANSTTPAYAGIIPRITLIGKKKYSAFGIPFLASIW